MQNLWLEFKILQFWIWIKFEYFIQKKKLRKIHVGSKSINSINSQLIYSMH